MTKIDNQFMEKLGEVLYDEKNAVNYKMVSIMFGVHVNIAKQMLYHFYTTNKEQGKKIHATYYLSGMVTWKTLCSMSPGGNRDTEENKKKSPDSESYLVLLCKDKDLEKYKAKFSRLFSVHVYALSSFPLENYDVLERLVEQPLVDSKGRTPLDFGSITCSESEKLLENFPVPSVPVVSNTVRAKEDIKKPEKEKERSSAPADNKGNKSSKEDVVEDTKTSSGQKTQKAVIAPAGEKTGANRLKNMFATAAAKPKPKPKVDKVEVKPAPKEVQKQSSKASNKSDSKARDSESRKRKRIRDVFSSSESEDEKKSDDEDSLPESPIPPKKRIQIDSDSEDDFKEVPKSGKYDSDKVSTAETTNQKPLAPGRRRVIKTVSETRVSDDGFLVTEKKQVLVSEDEDAEGEKESKAPSSKKPFEAKKVPDTQPSKPTSTSKPLSGKTKQPSLMSFFQKK